MTQAISNKRIFEEIQSLREDIHFIKKHMMDPDYHLTLEEEARFNESMTEYQSGKTKTLKDLKKELKC